ncbi:MAG TPA: PAS domain-containing protein, partial [Anaeromyxobacteraceae bacterium]|nr:PAS domain-containing protein [Anaeromyxobacteraceae bacterium]
MAILTPRSGTLRYRRRGLLLAVGLVVPFYPLDLLLGHACAASLCYELIWMAVLVAGALLQSYRTHRAADLAARLCGLATGFLFSLIVAATGNSNSPYFFYSLALPFSALVLLPDIPSAAALTTIGTLGGGVSIMLREGRGWRYVAVWSYLGLAACLLAALGAWLYSRVWQAKARAQRERLATALAAAKSERCRKRDVAIAYAQAMQSRDGLRKVLQSISDAVVVSRLDGSVTFVNGAGQRMLGIIPGSPITTRSVLDRVVPEDRAILLRRREAFAAGRNPEPSIVRVPGTSGLRECEISGVCVEFDGAPAIATVVRDITERRDMD